MDWTIHRLLRVITTLLCFVSWDGFGQVKLYWTATDSTGASLMKANSDGSNPTAIATGASNIRGPNGLEAINGVLYWPDQQLGEIRMVNPDGTGIAAFSSANNPYDVFGTSQQVYWTSQTGSYIDTQLLDGNGYQRILGSSSVTSPFAIEVTASHIYWSQVNGSGSIRRSDLSGGNIVTLIPNAFVYDFQVTANYIYFADNNYPSAIKRANLDGTGIVTLLADGGFYNGICVTEDALYWSAFQDAAGSGIRRMNLDGSNPVNLYNAPAGTSVRGIVVMAPTAGAPTPPEFTAASVVPSGFAYTLKVESGKSYRVETSPDLATWTEITNFTSAGTAFSTTNSIPPGTERLFHRARTP